MRSDIGSNGDLNNPWRGRLFVYLFSSYLFCSWCNFPLANCYFTFVVDSWFIWSLCKNLEPWNDWEKEFEQTVCPVSSFFIQAAKQSWAISVNKLWKFINKDFIFLQSGTGRKRTAEVGLTVLKFFSYYYYLIYFLIFYRSLYDIFCHFVGLRRYFFHQKASPCMWDLWKNFDLIY